MKKQIREFWKWFSENEKRFWNYNENNSHNFLLEIQEKLSFCKDQDDNEFSLEFAEVSPEIKRLEISPNAVVELFDPVMKIVNAAPEIAGWQFVAFRQPSPMPFALHFQKMEFDTANMSFQPFEDDDDELNLTIYGEGFSKYLKENETEFYHYALTTINNAIGEYNCVMRVKGYDFLDTSEIGDEEVYPLEELPDFLEGYYGDDEE